MASWPALTDSEVFRTTNAAIQDASRRVDGQPTVHRLGYLLLILQHADDVAFIAMAVSSTVFTDRLRLQIPAPELDSGDLFVIFSDPDSWWYDPAGRHLERSQTWNWLARARSRFTVDGLSYWTVREADSGTIVGVGGVQRQSTRAWNLNYRLAPAAQGRGYATELGRAALDSAALVDDEVPVIAWIADHNLPSRRVAERLGLHNQGAAVNPADGVTRLAYTDRPLGAFHG